MKSAGSVFLRFKSLGVLAIFVVLVVLLSIFSHDNNFIRLENIRNLLSYGSEFGIIVLGAGILMIVGEFDLSIGSVLAVTSLVFTLLFKAGLNPFLAFAITLAAGLVTGLINGLITVKAKILSFVATLGAMMLWRGTTLLISSGVQMPADTSSYKAFTFMFIGNIGGVIPMQAVWFVLAMIILYFLVHRHRFGNWIFATGDNSAAARSMCINTDAVKILAFMLVGFLTAFAAGMQTVHSAAFSSRAGTGWELRVIAASVVGGTSLLGGRGSMVGIFLGALIIVVIENALTIARLPYEWTYMVYGLVLMFAALLDLFIETRKLKSA
ncbi:MAG: ABC transporter permease [Spirochaetales bacterium]|nr:MAG: ABC transporter permease [Spirochaetales bacterium]